MVMADQAELKQQITETSGGLVMKKETQQINDPGARQRRDRDARLAAVL